MVTAVTAEQKLELVSERAMKITDVAARFNVHRRTVERWFRRGLKHFYLGDTPYTTLEEIARFARMPEPASSVPVASEPDADTQFIMQRYGVTSLV